MHEYNYNYRHQEKEVTEKLNPFLISLGKTVMQEVQSNVSVFNKAIGKPDHDTHGIKMPLKFLEDNEACPKNVT